eukprot:TRINITY_DN2259_c0_g1_i1.p1 TRINITY_DN2259_c0_g1~~TRINITY_DN2259_c0_g1_i1.p1  ORF type:complete len:177 (-),score=29.52 TRINITY_DN2259_c0_g1_i1:23-553(-)
MAEQGSEQSRRDEEMAKQLQMEYDEEYQKELKEENEEPKLPQIGEFVVQLLDDLWNNRNFKIIDDSFSDDCVSRSPWGNTVGRNEFKSKFVMPMIDSFPDLKYVSHEVFQEGQRIVNRWTFSGTHTGAEFASYPALGNKMNYSGITINRIGEEGTIVETSSFFDRLALFEQLQKSS